MEDPYSRSYSLTQSGQIWCDNKGGGVACSRSKPRSRNSILLHTVWEATTTTKSR